MEITVPNNFEPREYQLPILKAIDNGIKKNIIVWHRRAGKDKTCFSIIAKKALERVGIYYYFFPTYKQGKKALWENIDKSGFKTLNHIPECLVKNKNSQEMVLELINGSIIRVVGTDNVDSIVGTNPVGAVFSEYSLQDPRAWDLLRPIFLENGGWVIFNFTPRGENHAKKLLDMGMNKKNWFTQILTVDDTHILTPEQLDEEREEIIKKNGDDSLFLQEYYCSFSASITGAYYGELIKIAEKENRICSIPIENIKVDTHWDLGMNDTTVIIFTQKVGLEIRVIDYYENLGEGLAHYAKVLQDKGYIYNNHFGPHDIAVRELGTGISRKETAKKMGINFSITPNIGLLDGIEHSRNTFNKIWIDKDRCSRLVDCLKNYHKKYDEKNKIYSSKPDHDWSSNGADAFRYMCINLNKVEVKNFSASSSLAKAGYSAFNY